MATAPDVKQASLIRRWNEAGQEVKSIFEAARAAKSDRTKLDYFNGKYRILEKYYSRFEDLRDSLYDYFAEIGKPNDFPDSKQAAVIQSVRSYYMEAHEIHAKLNVDPPPVQNISNTIESGAAWSNLPKINVPKFDGEFINWPKFRDTFTSMVHTAPGLSPTQKFHHLIGALTGTAHSVISNLTISDANYAVAWKALEDTYENKRVLASVYLNTLLSVKPLTGKPNIESYRSFLSQTSDTIAAFKLLNVPNESDFILFHLAVRCLDSQTREQFEFALNRNEFPTIVQLTNFVRERQLALQLSDSNATFNKPSTSNTQTRSNSGKKFRNNHQPNETSRTSLLANSSKPSGQKSQSGTPSKPSSNENSPCIVCKGKDPHTLPNCPTFYTISVKQRVDALRNWEGCRNCLSAKHDSSQCKSQYPCRFCKGHHNSMLCLKFLQPPVSTANKGNSGNPEPLPGPSTNLLGTTLNSGPSEYSEPQVLLGTAWAEILDARGHYQKVRLVVDSASQYSYMTQRCLYRLGLNMLKVPRRISCLGGTIFDGAKGVVPCELRPRNDSTINLTTEAVVVKNITSFLPSVPVPQSIWKRYLNFELADPKFFQPSSVDFLLGADLFPDVMTGDIQSVGVNLPKVFSSVFGYIVIGKYSEDSPSNATGGATSLFALNHSNDDLNFKLEKFWELEEINDNLNNQNPDHIMAEEFFVKHHYRSPSGRFGVRLPFKGAVPDLSASDSVAKKRFFNLENKFRRNPELKRQYSDFMKEYIELGHMEPTTNESKYVIPHHGVIKEDRNKIKLRVVFDASCRTEYGSLNDYLLTGEPLQNDIRDILINFRAHRIVFVADAVKMYRQIEVSPLDRAFQHIYWRFDVSESLQKFELTTVTYGMACSPHLSLRCIKALQIEHADEFPLASQVLSRDIFVDDIATGADSEPEALKLQRQVIGIMAKGCFSLSKWASNSQAILDTVHSGDQENSPIELSSDENNSLKVLGLKWYPKNDTFSYNICVPPEIIYTKRAIMSTVASIFDPLGFLSPAVLLFKVHIQELWRAKVNWDDKIPDQLANSWHELMVKIPLLSQIEIDRFVCAEKPYTYQIVGYCDASESGYCASLYIRIIKENKITVKLLTAKTKVAPVKQETIPRLELCGAWLLARLYRSLGTFCELLASQSLPPVFFTDSSIVLGWINTPTHKLKVFVCNRISRIHEITPVTSWRHVDGVANPSDCGSRGLTPDKLLDHKLWWTGPSWLSLPMESWPKSKVEYNEILPETKRVAEPPVALLSCSALPYLIDWMARFSSYRKLIRVTALILRVIHNRKYPKTPRSGAYLLVEIVQAFYTCVRLVQLYEFFKGDMKNISKIQIVYKSLSPFLDEKGILRVGGRIENAEVNMDHKHQILLPYQSHLSTLIVDFYHSAYFHAGPNLLQALLQTRFWIPAMRRLVRQRLRKCLKCFKLRAKAIIPSMGNLPDYRLKQGRSFMHCGIDFAGPFSMRDSNRRKASISKVYLCLYICMVTKALHLETVTSLSTEAFLASFSRFMSRRGIPCAVYTDCGTNFVGASKELKRLEKWYNEDMTQRNISDFSTQHSIQWYFNPPYSPHFGGLWEAGVKSVKRHLTLVAGETPMTYEEISTLFTKIEAVLNSRPLCPLSDDPNESDYLSPGHFLIGEPLLSNPEPTLLDTKMNTLSRWQMVKAMAEKVWARWRLEYLSTLQKRTKWLRNPAKGLQEGDLVLVKTKEAPPLRWPTGKVLMVHPGEDGQVRVVTLRTANSTYKRTTANLIPLLPLQGDSEDEQ